MCAGRKQKESSLGNTFLQPAISQTVFCRKATLQDVTRSAMQKWFGSLRNISPHACHTCAQQPCCTRSGKERKISRLNLRKRRRYFKSWREKLAVVPKYSLLVPCSLRGEEHFILLYWARDFLAPAVWWLHTPSICRDLPQRQSLFKTPPWNSYPALALGDPEEAELASRRPGRPF